MTSLATARADYTVDEVAACKTAGDCPKSTDICFDDACIPGPDASNGLGATCTSGSGCAAGLCVGSGSADTDKKCTIDCDGSNACPSGYACTGTDTEGNPECLEKPSSGGCNSGGDGVPTGPLALGAGLLAVMVRRRRSAA